MEPAVTLKATPENPDVGDMFLSPAGEAVFHTALALEVAQRLTVAFSYFRGEWFLDLDEGTPYFQYILVKNPQPQMIRSIFTQLITGTEGVDALTKFGYAISSARELTLTFEARLKDGSTFKSSQYGRFVVAV